MKILIDIGHPAHVHYFRNFIKIMQSEGHEFLITARDKEVAFKLLSSYNIPFVSRGRGGRSLFGKLLYLLYGDYKILRAAKIFKPDLFLSFSSPYAAQVSAILKKPHITLDDTEHAKYEHLLYKPFTSTILTPNVFYKNMGAKHIKFNSYMELCYLHPNYFSPLIDVTSILNINPNDKYIILRFVSWNANHDIGQKGLSYNYKLKIIKELSKNYKVFVSSEEDLPSDIIKYQLKIKPELLHSILYHAQLYIGEGSTTASECSVLGTPNIYVNSLFVSYCTEQEELYKLSSTFRNENGVLEKAKELLSIPNLKLEWHHRRQKMLEDKIDVTAFLVWFVTNYPESFQIMKKNPDYQYNFK